MSFLHVDYHEITLTVNLSYIHIYFFKYLEHENMIIQYNLTTQAVLTCKFNLIWMWWTDPLRFSWQTKGALTRIPVALYCVPPSPVSRSPANQIAPIPTGPEHVYLLYIGHQVVIRQLETWLYVVMKRPLVYKEPTWGICSTIPGITDPDMAQGCF